jgi:hypothetical protein
MLDQALHTGGDRFVADELAVEDEALAFTYRGVCGHGSTFDYAG